MTWLLDCPQGCFTGDVVNLLKGSFYNCWRILAAQKESCHFFAFGVVVVLITAYPFEAEKLPVRDEVLTSDRM